MGGPPLVKMATGEESDAESLGGVKMHAEKSGLADYFAEDEMDAMIGRGFILILIGQKKLILPILSMKSQLMIKKI